MCLGQRWFAFGQQDADAHSSQRCLFHSHRLFCDPRMIIRVSCKALLDPLLMQLPCPGPGVSNDVSLLFCQGKRMTLGFQCCAEARRMVSGTRPKRCLPRQMLPPLFVVRSPTISPARKAKMPGNGATDHRGSGPWPCVMFAASAVVVAKRGLRAVVQSLGIHDRSFRREGRGVVVEHRDLGRRIVGSTPSPPTATSRVLWFPAPRVAQTDP